MKSPKAPAPPCSTPFWTTTEAASSTVPPTFPLPNSANPVTTFFCLFPLKLSNVRIYGDSYTSCPMTGLKSNLKTTSTGKFCLKWSFVPHEGIENVTLSF